MTLIEQLQDGMAKLHEDNNVAKFTIRIDGESALIKCERGSEQFWRKWAERHGAVTGQRFFHDAAGPFGCEDEYRHGSD